MRLGDILHKPPISTLIHKAERFFQTDMHYVVRGSFWITLSQIVQFAAGLLSSVAFANLIEPEVYGKYKFVLSIVAVLSITALGSMGTAVGQAVARGFEGSIKRALHLKLLYGTLGTLASLVLAGYYFFNGNTELTFLFLITAPFIAPAQAFGIYAEYLQAKKDFRTLSKCSVIQSLVITSIMVTTLFLTDSIYYLITAYFVSRTFISFTLYSWITHRHPFNTEKDPKTIGYGLYLSALGIIPRISTEIDKVLLWTTAGPAVVATYTVALAPVGQILNTAVGHLTQLSFPKMSATPEATLKKTLPMKVLKLYVVIIPVIIVYIIVAPFLYALIYPQYLASVAYSQWFALSLLVLPISLISTNFVAKVKKKELVVTRVVLHVIKIALFVILIPLYGIAGAVATILVTGALHTVVAYLMFAFSRPS